MPRDPATVLQIKLMFAGLNGAGRINIYPEAGSLREALNNLINSSTSSSPVASQAVIRNFATASIEMWHKSIHSFLISASLTKASPVWASVSGYYSSHYAIRGFAHLLGYFLLYSRNKSTIKLEVNNTQHICNILPKTRADGEHRFYCTKVHQHPDFVLDPFFTFNNEFLDESDSGHRNKANYYDHIYGFPPFQILDAASLKERVQVISGMPFYDAPIPNKRSYADIESVQLVAYYRLVKFRSFLDEILGTGNSYWSYHRNPLWCSNFIKYQTIQSDFESVYSE
jgi:hypothetical protein